MCTCLQFIGSDEVCIHNFYMIMYNIMLICLVWYTKPWLKATLQELHDCITPDEVKRQSCSESIVIGPSMETCIVCSISGGCVCTYVCTYMCTYVYPVQYQCSHVSQLRCVSLPHIFYDVGGSHIVCVCVCVCPCVCAFVLHSLIT